MSRSERLRLQAFKNVQEKENKDRFSKLTETQKAKIQAFKNVQERKKTYLKSNSGRSKSKRSNYEYIVIYLISFLVTWLLFIFYLEKEEFDIEYKEKGTTQATVFNLDTEEIVEELYDGRKAVSNIVGYLEYSYTVNGKEYKYGSSLDGKRLHKGDNIKIEYVKDNPNNSRMLGSYTISFFRKNLVPVVAVSFLVMFGIIYLLSIFKSKGYNSEN
ncbi:hypothetical protein PXD56_13720 [Maribacter sp. SA7]|uniref:DUF3592 domain-containing protein n=1 Tax=Maribacter zhoushanensis TaxID=3030012 RepID=UPI0023EB0B7F|nr:DUF3592 domain-containing protein [Maribacter zhoushanensis]MDF4204026.1 hypothetical protein [Maribacter zhoushanensis]